MPTVLFTGFPGFLGSALLPKVLARSSDATALCLVQPKFAAMARRRVDERAAEHPLLGHRIRFVEGDICQPNLGLSDEITRRGRGAGVDEGRLAGLDLPAVHRRR